MLSRPALLLLLLAALPARAALSPAEAELSRSLAEGRLPEPAADAGARLLAARGAVLLALGEREKARGHFESAAAGMRDCSLRARLAELGVGAACPELLPGRLEPALLGVPAAFAIIAPEDGSRGSSFLVRAMSDAMESLAPAGALSIESTADRFRVTGASALEGLLYADDRLLLIARPAPGRDAGEALTGLRSFLDRRSAAPSPEPEPDAAASPSPPSMERRQGLVVYLPAGWQAVENADRWLAPGSAEADRFPPAAGALELKLPGDPPPRARKNPLARRKKKERAPAPELAALPARARLLTQGRVDLGDSTATELTWERPGEPAARRSLLRTFVLDGRVLLAVAHCSTEGDRSDCAQVLRGVERVRPQG